MVSQFTSRLTNQSFSDWHTLNEQLRNKADGYDDTRNDPSYTPPVNKHSPSSLLNCHRMVYYDSQNTPREQPLPHGIFKFGHDFEDYVEGFLNWVSPEGTEIRNPVHVSFAENDVVFEGSTDPVLFDSDGNPMVLVEVKTTKNLFFVRRDGVKTRHKAQSHAYAKGLQHRFDLDEPPQIVVIYGNRETLETETFTVSFDDEFWTNTVVDWAEENTEYRLNDELPPTIDVNGPNGHMCSWCDYKERCGNYEPSSGKPGTDSTSNIDDYWWDDSIHEAIQNQVTHASTTGFLPLKKYPEDAVISHLATHENVKLTPTVAAQYPELVEDGSEPSQRLEHLYGVSPTRDVYDWECPACDATYEFGTFDWNGNLGNIPTCQSCNQDAPLHGPLPSKSK